MSWLRRALGFLRGAFGVGAYERHCEWLRLAGRAANTPTRRQFYLESLEHRYDRPSGCC